MASTFTAVVALGLTTTAVAAQAGAPHGSGDGAGGVPVSAAAGAPPARSSAPGAGAAAAVEHTVTLLTGDVVRVRTLGDGRQTVDVTPADPASGVRTQQVGSDLYVLPDAALPYLAADRLDRRLFNVSLLIANQYDDASRGSTPLIAQYTGERAMDARAAEPVGLDRVLRLESIDAAGLEADKSVAAQTWAALTAGAAQPVGRSAPATWPGGITKLWLDDRVGAALDESEQQIHAPDVWAAGFDGSGTTVAVLDSGVDAEHPDLADRLDEVRSFVPDASTNDVTGHGTHVASTVAGTGAASEGRYRGTAPGATLDVGKVLDDSGFGQASWIIAGMEWAAEQAPVVSMSIGTSEPSDGTDPMSMALDEISEESGALFVVAAGNTWGGLVGAPGAADSALTVSAVGADDTLADFSSIGPRLTDGMLKPDLAAPGVDITAARSQDSPGEGAYVDMSGTSMATPHVAGTAALLLQARPDLTGPELKDVLTSTAEPLDLPAYQTGTGRLDARRAVLTDVSATGSAYLGYYDWPHGGDGVARRPIRYTNRGDEPVELSLTLSATDLAGQPAPAGVFGLSATTVSVPAHGSVSVEVTGDPSLAEVGATYSGLVTASAGGDIVTRTATGLSKEAERYDLTLDAVGRDGGSGQLYATVLNGAGGLPFAVEVDGRTTLRLEPGTFSVMSFASFDQTADSSAIALLGDPSIRLDRDRTVSLDLRKVRPVSVDVGRPTDATARRLDYFVDNGVPFNETLLVPELTDDLYAAPTGWLGRDRFEMDTRWRLRSETLRIAAGGTVLDEIHAPGSAWFPDGSHRWELVDVGTASPEDVAAAGSLRGRMAVATRSPQVTPFERTDAVAEAGAEALLVVNDGPAEFSEGVFDPEGGEITVPVAQVSGTEGRALLDRMTRATVTATIAAEFSSPYVYDLLDVHSGGVPGELSYRPRQRDLARVDAAYGAPWDLLGGEFRYDFRPWTPFGVGFQQIIALPQERVEWVSTQPGTSWYQGTRLLDTEWEQRDVRRTYRAGRAYESSWYHPVIRPRLGEGYWPPYRQGDFVQVNVPAASDGEPGHVGTMGDAVRQELIEVYADGELVASDDMFGVASFEAATEETPYRVVVTTRTSPEVWPTSTRTRTAWAFESAHVPEGESGVLPLLQLDYGIATDLRGRAPAGRPVRLTLDAGHLAEATGIGRVRQAGLSVSYDGGATWRPMRLTGRDGHWTTVVHHPRRPGSFVSIRASASDTAGNRIRQTVIRAYRLR